ncbi:putative rna-directed dna polymerase from transposon bs [Nephila pilipes]|uniref:Putative rna-directed dna polymerase from transposon bs n=1 Tax=Nephila pilipes TaxID=299642 RepID=A0A8X6U7A7_NEPPI|nr:putative rna-directed dna polymerase from transposon bs [Nephila pilipes]
MHDINARDKRELDSSNFDVSGGYREFELRLMHVKSVEAQSPPNGVVWRWSDGSATGAHTSAGVYSRHFSLGRAIGQLSTNFDDEVDVVHVALAEIARREEQNIVAFIDSQATNSSIIPSTNSSALKCQHLIDSKIKSGRNVAQQWIPSHCGIAGNEFADSLAKAGFNLPQSDPPASYHSIERIITAKFKAKYGETIINLTSEKTWDSFNFG